MPVMTIIDDLTRISRREDFDNPPDDQSPDDSEDSKLKCDSCGEPILKNEKYWILSSVGREMDPFGDSDLVSAVCLMCAPHGFEISLEVNEDDD